MELRKGTIRVSEKKKKRDYVILSLRSATGIVVQGIFKIRLKEWAQLFSRVNFY